MAPDIAAMARPGPGLDAAALARWDNEGGAAPTPGQASVPHARRGQDGPWLIARTRLELALLRRRVMGSEPLLLAMLASASDRHLDGLRHGEGRDGSNLRSALQPGAARSFPGHAWHGQARAPSGKGGARCDSH